MTRIALLLVLCLGCSDDLAVDEVSLIGDANGLAGEGGQSGEGGVAGESGQSGEGGMAGESGQSGEGGVAGESGQSGEGGMAGESGQSGEGGMAGESGQSGEGGMAGESGQSGEGGMAGESGQSGEGGMAGESGQSGEGGMAGESGQSGEGGMGPPAPACDDNEQNGSETDVDCGAECPPCPDEFSCRESTDCDSQVCLNGRCEAARCGDGVINGDEQCDDGDANGGDGCQADCTLPTCGNGVIDAGEGSCDCREGSVNLDDDPANGCECMVINDEDDRCDGVDEDCDGEIDEGYRRERTQCGAGACLAQGETSCIDGEVIDDCTPGEAAQEDRTCDGIDSDCNGTVDEDYRPSATECGVGACLASGEIVCRDGAEIDTCIEGQPTGDDADCDGVDDDCDGAIDEGFVIPPDDEGECLGFDSPCDESGTRTVRRTSCVDGQRAFAEVAVDCGRDTDGAVTRDGDWGACGGYADACDESGSQSRDHFVCRDGNEVNEPQAQDCGRDTDGTVTRNGNWGACGGYADACDESGSQSRDHFVCRDGNEVNEPQAQDCGRDTDGTVTRNGNWGACGGYADACDESGSQSRDHLVCRDGNEVNEPQAQDCGRDTDGTVTRNGNWGACGGYADACDESGSQSRDHFVCRDGNEVNEPQSQGCGRDTDGTVTRNGNWGACGGYADACDESGSQSRDHFVCRGGNEVNEPQSQGCGRDTDGTVTRNGNWGACGGYADACDESGSQSRDHFVCRGGNEVNEPQSQGCGRDTDGTVTRDGDWGACGGYADACDESGSQSRDHFVCRDGNEVNEPQSQGCGRDTDGTVTRNGNWGACGGYADDCDESGSQSRDHFVCRGGNEVNEPQSQGCGRDTDGTVTRNGNWGACGGYANACDESGSQSRDRFVCRGGNEVNEPQSQGCGRDTDGTVTRNGNWGACGGYANACDESGSQSRDRFVCRGGNEVNEPQSQGCGRDTDGTVTRNGNWGACGGYANACDESGSQSRDRFVCRGGNEVNEPQSQGCGRDTDGTVTRNGNWGACGGYANACDESGSQSRDRFVCRGGNEVNEPQSQGCGRDTDGTVTRNGNWGACGGYANACDESGSQSRDRFVCRGGNEVNEPQSQGCGRDTDGTVTRNGNWGACGGYANACDESGSQSRDRFVCRGGNEVNEPQSQGCGRDTDGTVTRNGNWGACGGYANACDESGSQSRDRFVCRGGNEVNEPQSQGCGRDTDGTVTRNGNWGACGGYANACDESGSQSRDRFVCRGGNEVNEPQSQGCGRDTDGTVTRNGNWGACGGYANACDESGTRTRSRTVCRNGVETNENESGACGRDTDGEICIDQAGCRITQCSNGVCPSAPNNCQFPRRCCEPGICVQGNQFCP